MEYPHRRKPCWNGPECRFLAQGRCTFFHPLEHRQQRQTYVNNSTRSNYAHRNMANQAYQPFRDNFMMQQRSSLGNRFNSSSLRTQMYGRSNTGDQDQDSRNNPFISRQNGSTQNNRFLGNVQINPFGRRVQARNRNVEQRDGYSANQLRALRISLRDIQARNRINQQASDQNSNFLQELIERRSRILNENMDQDQSDQQRSQIHSSNTFIISQDWDDIDEYPSQDYKWFLYKNNSYKIHQIPKQKLQKYDQCSICFEQFGKETQKKQQKFIPEQKPARRLQKIYLKDQKISHVQQQEEDLVFELFCQHLYHKKCISEWLKKKPQCAVCRKDFRDHKEYQKWDTNFRKRFQAQTKIQSRVVMPLPLPSSFWLPYSQLQNDHPSFLDNGDFDFDGDAYDYF